MMETSLMVNDYPEPQESNSQEYIFKVSFEGQIKVSVVADNYDEAVDIINRNNFNADNVEYLDDFGIKDILESDLVEVRDL